MNTINFFYNQEVRELFQANSWDRQVMEASVSEELSNLLEGGMSGPYNFIFHVFTVYDTDFIMQPTKIEDRDFIEVSLCEYIDGPVIEEGPFAGKQMTFPTVKSAGTKH